MMDTRRSFLGKIALGLGVACCRGAFAQPAEKARYVGIETEASNGLSRASFFASNGARMGRVALDFRAHGMADHGRILVVFPRRPGDRFSVIDKESLKIKTIVRAPADRHFFGHGAFTQDGKHLLVTENDLETLSGFIGIYEIADKVRRVGQFELPGSGPHEIATPSDKRPVSYCGGRS